jgi:hypothetical protein
LGVNGCEHCTTVVHGRNVLNQCFDNQMFSAWLCAYMQNHLGADRAVYLIPSRTPPAVDPALQPLAGWRNVITALCDPAVIHFIHEQANARGMAAQLMRIVAAINGRVGHPIINASPESCELHDTLMVDRILFSGT